MRRGRRCALRRRGAKEGAGFIKSNKQRKLPVFSNPVHHQQSRYRLIRYRHRRASSSTIHDTKVEDSSVQNVPEVDKLVDGHSTRVDETFGAVLFANPEAASPSDIPTKV
ncbi:hypothetical protein EVAR_30626_1 [Eumeta japonica]|uniref:Uncharacterized protein n=1 Tax=Eumeta variegata TaxID=151549 RepID=A0A4C1W831_EUMVA|nr:hypothetical protein EVAR_30626_1 [Eumeta japonica]